ncbi:MAG: 16S rRNA methyltransferase [Asgard group archaeon]|nr:16S rRNA methyltransferase [Asgard group archaeon]
MPKTIFLFADTALELIPQELYYNEIIKKHASNKKKKPSQILLDSSYHYNAMKSISNFKKRGRPDIIHFCLMNLIESTLVIDNPSSIEIYIHTITNKLIEVKSETRLPKNFDRFKGLMVKLFHQKKIDAEGKILMKILENENLHTVLSNIKPNKRFIFSFKGKRNSLKEIFEKNCDDDIAIIIGGFPYGNLSKQIIELTQNVVSIFPAALKAWIVLNKVIYTRENTLNKGN